MKGKVQIAFKQLTDTIKNEADERKTRKILNILTNSTRKIVNSFSDVEIVALRGFATKKEKNQGMTTVEEPWGIKIKKFPRIRFSLSHNMSGDQPMIQGDEILNYLNKYNIVDIPIEKLILRFEDPRIVRAIEERYKKASEEVEGLSKEGVNLPEDDKVFCVFRREKPIRDGVIKDDIEASNKFLKEKWGKKHPKLRENLDSYHRYATLRLSRIINETIMRTFRKRRQKELFKNLDNIERIIHPLKKGLKNHLHEEGTDFCDIQTLEEKKEEGWVLVDRSTF